MSLQFDVVVEQLKKELADYCVDGEFPQSVSVERDGHGVKINLQGYYNIAVKDLTGLLKVLRKPDLNGGFIGDWTYLRSEQGTVWFDSNGIRAELSIPTDPIVAALAHLYRKTTPLKGKESSETQLENMSVTIYQPEDGLGWDALVGYEEAKDKIKKTVLAPLKHPEIYEEMVQLTRVRPEPNIPRGVLFEGPPGTGKTLSARILAGIAGVPLIKVNIESLMTKWISEGYKNLGKVFKICEEGFEQYILFFDEIDCFAVNRGTTNANDEYKFMLSVLLRNMDGMDASKNARVIAATNRKSDLDNALLSRFSTHIYFPPPNEVERAGIFAFYAKQLKEEDHTRLAEATLGYSGRNIRDVCSMAELSWGIRRTEAQGKGIRKTPTAREYLRAIEAQPAQY